MYIVIIHYKGTEYVYSVLTSVTESEAARLCDEFNNHRTEAVYYSAGISDKHAAALIAILNNSSITVYASFTGNRYWILGRNKAYEICRHMGLEYKMNEANTEMVFR